MTLQDAILAALKSSVMLVMFALGLRSRWQDTTYFVNHPGLLGRSLVAMDLVMPAFAILAIAVTALPNSVKIALAALSVSPVPPLMPGRAAKTGDTQDYAVGLLVAASVVALVFVPLAVGLVGATFGVAMHVSFFTVALLMTMLILGPLAAGIVVRHFWPALAQRIAGPLGIVALVLLVICALLVILKMWPEMMLLVGNGTLLVFAAFVLVGLAAGHLLGGPDPDNRSVLAIATSARHPGVAIAIAIASSPQKRPAIAAVLLYLLVSALTSFPYVFWRGRRAAAPASAGTK